MNHYNGELRDPQIGHYYSMGERGVIGPDGLTLEVSPAVYGEPLFLRCRITGAVEPGKLRLCEERFYALIWPRFIGPEFAESSYDYDWAFAQHQEKATGERVLPSPDKWNSPFVKKWRHVQQRAAIKEEIIALFANYTSEIDQLVAKKLSDNTTGDRVPIVENVQPSVAVNATAIELGIQIDTRDHGRLYIPGRFLPDALIDSVRAIYDRIRTPRLIGGVNV